LIFIVIYCIGKYIALNKKALLLAFIPSS